MRKDLLTATLALLLTTEARGDWFLNQEQEAYRHFQAGQYDQAAKVFSDPFRRGVSLYKTGRFQEAADAFKRVERPAVKEDAAYNLGNARFQLGDYPGAVEAYEAVLGANPDHEDAYHNLSLARAMLARIEQEAYEKEKAEQEREEAEERREKEEQERLEREEQESFLCGRLGERAFSQGLSVSDDAANGIYAGLPFDGEGTPKERVELIEAGVPRRVVTDRRWARKRGVVMRSGAAYRSTSRPPIISRSMRWASGALSDELRNAACTPASSSAPT